MQFGVRQKYSTSHALISLTENIRQALDKRYIGCGIFVDLRKAFCQVDHEQVDHEILLSNLDYYAMVFEVYQIIGSKQKQFDCEIKLKLTRKRLSPTDSVNI